MRTLLPFLLLASACFGQTFEALFTPEPEAVLDTLHITQLGVWSIRVYNSGATQPNIAPTLLLLQAPEIHWVESSLCLSILTSAQAATPAMRAAQIITIGAGVAGVFGGTGIIAMSRAVLGDLAGASLTANYAATQLKTLAPNIAPFTSTMLTGPVSVAPGADAVFTMCADPTDAATPSISSTAATMAIPQRAIPVPAAVYRKHGPLGLGHKSLIVVHAPIHRTFTIQ
jgi:hypothetical protein